MSIEECFDLVVSGAFDLAVVVVIDVVTESHVRVVKSIVVVGVVVADVGAGGKRGPLVNAERFGATDPSTANNGGLRGGAVGDAGCEVVVLGGEVEPRQNRIA